MNKITLHLLVLLFSIPTFSQFSENFENTTGPNPLPSTTWTLDSGNWAVHDNGVGLTRRWGMTNVISNVHSGLNSAYIDRENIGFSYTSEDYLTTPMISVPVNGQLSFASRTTISDDQGTLYLIKVSSALNAQTDLSNSTILATYNENEISIIYNAYEEKVIDLAAYAGQNIYITFARIFTQPTAGLGGDRWLIDNVNVYSASSCLTPINPIITDVNFPNATVSWTETGSATQWEIIVLPSWSNPTASSVGTIVTTNPATITNLPNSLSNVYVRSICSSVLKSNWSTIAIATCPSPINLNNYNVTHQSATVSWTNNSSATLWQVVALPCGSPAPTNNTTLGVITTSNPFIITGLNPYTCYNVYVKAICSTNDSSDWSIATTFTTMLAPLECGDLFVDNGGSNANYLNYSNNHYTICPTNPGEVVTVSFTEFNTEANKDGLYVFDGNSLNSPQIASANGAGNVPGGLAGSFWGTTIPGPFTSSSPSGCLTFRFISNDTITGLGWTSNVSCGPMGSACISPSQPVLSNITINSATISWNDNNASTAWDVLVLPFDAPAPTNLTAGWISAPTNPFVITGLTANCYKVYVRSICDFVSNQKSNWSAPASLCDCALFGTCSDYILAIAFIDSNGNGIKDATESNFNFGTFSNSINDGTPTYYYSNDGDLYIPSTNPLNSYDLNFIIPTFLNSHYTSSTNFNNITITAGSGANYYYFPVTEITPYIDVSTGLSATNPRPGFLRNCYLYYRNNSLSTAISSGNITFTKNNLETITSISQPGIVATANGFTYSYTNLAPNETRFISIVLQTPTIPTVNLGDLLTLSSNISAASVDLYPLNNNYSLTQTVIGSYDPNEIYESRGPEILFSNFTLNDYLYYTVTFENTGTANAEFVRIENLLDIKLDPSSIEMVASSHNYDLKRENNELTWFFYNINLPPTSLNPILSHGFVTYRIKPNPGYSIGDIIPNTANIFFDYNPAIVTNTFTTEFTAALNNQAFDGTNFTLYPNPASQFINISLNNTSEIIDNVIIYDVLGKIIKEVKSISSNSATIDTSSLSKGVYLLEITTENGLKQNKKLVIK